MVVNEFNKLFFRIYFFNYPSYNKCDMTGNPPNRI